MSTAASLGTTVVFKMAAIPTMTGDADTIQIGGSTDGVFHVDDATADNVKPFKFDDLGSGNFYPGVALRGVNGAHLGTPDNPLVVSQSSNETPITFNEALPQGNNQLGAMVPVCGKVMDENGNMLPVKTDFYTETTDISIGDAFEIL